VQLAVKLIGTDTGKSLLQFAVADTGHGLSPAEAVRIFDAFTQANASTTRTHGGAGLGLSISKELATLLGGDLQVKTLEGHGSTFTLTIDPGSLAGIPLVDPLTEDPDTLRGLDSLSTLKFLHRVKAMGLKVRILLVDDCRDNQRLIGSVLERAGLKISLAGDGSEGVEQALASCDAGRPFDVILMDMQMPKLDGYGATRKLRVAGYAGPIIALTANAMRGDRKKCAAAGCDGYVTKPIDRKELVKAILDYLPKGELS
jgi:CheY-like chemotaxis protein